MAHIHRFISLVWLSLLLANSAFCDDACPAKISTKWDLWAHGVCLRGANIWQKKIDPSQDDDSLGDDYIGPPFTVDDFRGLAAMGANYVNLSVPGIFSEKAPYQKDAKAVAHLDSLLAMAKEAGLFAVISFRTGPGRSEGGFDDSTKPDSLNTVWTDADAQDGWVAMWHFTAGHYRTHPVVVGFDLMVEPNSNDIALNVSDVDEFYPKYAGTLYDWNPLAKRITDGIREVDQTTPILVGGLNYSDVSWLSALKPTGDPRTVYTVHQYGPDNYTHQKPQGKRTYPGIFDAWGDGKIQVDKSWLSDLMSPLDTFKRKHRAPVAINEYGAMRWEKGVGKFIGDSLELFEGRGIAHAIWLWEPRWKLSYDEFNFRHGPDAKHHSDVKSSELMNVLRDNWGRTTLRPSDVNFQTGSE